jgi:hypothetical protein
MPTRARPSIRRIRTLALLVAVVALLIAPTALAAKSKEGWGKPKSFVGRYHAKIQSGGKLQVVGGQLTMFMQEEYPGSLQPAGILNLKTKSGNNDLVYLTSLHSKGTGRGAEIHGGAFIGPKIGSFAGTATAPGKLRATFNTGGLGTVKAVFVRFSTSPKP